MRWHIHETENAVVWDVKPGECHTDDIEMAGSIAQLESFGQGITPVKTVFAGTEATGTLSQPSTCGFLYSKRFFFVTV